MAASVFLPPTLRKSTDAEIAAALGVSPRAVKSWRLNERPTPPDLEARLLRYRAERAIARIAAERAELNRIIDEAAANDLDLATLVRRDSTQSAPAA